MESQMFAGINDTDFNPKHAVSWLEEQPEDLQLWQPMFQELLQGAAKPRQSSGNACVKLYGFVEQCSKSSQEALRDFAFAKSTALKLFDFFMEWNEQDSHRSMRLVLDYLAYSIIKNPAHKVGASLKATILNNTLSTITQQSSRPSIKSAILALDYFVQKKLVYLSHVLEIYRQIHGLSPDKDALWNTFIAKIFAWMELHYVCPIAGKLLVTIFTSSWDEGRDIRHQPEKWHEFIYKGMQLDIEYLEPIKLYIFVPLFKTDRTGSLKYVHHLTSLQRLTGNNSSSWDLNSMLWLAMLEAGKKVGAVDEPGHGLKQDTKSTFQLRPDILENVLCHDSHEARSSAISILIASPSTTKPYTAEALGLLKQHLPSFHEDPDPKMRYDVLGHSRNMIKRIQNTIESLRKESERILKKMNKIASKEADGQAEKHQTDAVAEVNNTLRQHEDYVSWYVGFLKNELAPTASYQRHITALKAMMFVLKPALLPGNSVDSPSELRTLLVDKTWFRSVLDLIMDPFDDVRETAASLIMSLSPECGDSELQKQVDGLEETLAGELRSFCSKADELARRTARADHSDGAARSFELLCRWCKNAEDRMQIPFSVLSNLEAKLAAAEQDLANAVLQAPVHGSFASLRYIWGSLSSTNFSETELESLAELQDRAIACGSRIWQIVKHVLCDDSPEGHLPEELEEVDGLDTKDLLSYSFRAIHESSNLMRIIASNARQTSGRGLLVPSRRNFEAIGRLTFDELSNLRHRGAFTTVSQTFTSCCQLVKHFPNDGSSLLDEWYQGAVNCINTQASTTRRSAGIPALIVGILSSSADHPSFEDVIRNLQDIGRRPALVSETDGSNLPQVHALNCIKDIFKSSYLSKRADSYLTECLELAANSLRSEIWAIRNCGLLLLRSLIDCLFGTSESKTSIEAGWDGRTVKIPYHKFKALPALLVNLLEMGQQSKGVLIGSQTAESVFPALDIIRRAGPPEEFRNKLYDIIAWYLGSRIWHVREIAARTLCSFLLKPGWLGSVEELLANSGTSANKSHGTLLTLKFLLERLADVMPDQLSDDDIGTGLVDILTRLPSVNPCVGTCPETRAVYIEIASFVAKLSYTGVLSLRHTTYEPSNSLLSRTLETGNDSDKSITSTSALLKIRITEASIQLAFGQAKKGVDSTLESLLTNISDINAVCSVLERLSTVDLAHLNEVRAILIDSYVQVCFKIDAPEPRTIAIENLAALVDTILGEASGKRLEHLPTDETIAQLWADLRGKPMNPSLSDAIIRVSGPLFATAVSRSEGSSQGGDLEAQLRSWGAMMSDAGMADQTFDTRMAAVNAIHSFSSSIAFPPEETSDPSIAHLPWLLALYDALNDDDDEIRAAAATAASPILSNQRLVSVEAGLRLLHWLQTHFSDTAEFRAHVARRMTGHTLPAAATVAEETETALLSDWTPAEAQLTEAMRFDDALFVIEEQNLYVDEVREARRWTDVFSSLPPPPPSAPSPSSSDVAATLSQWTLAGLQTLTRLARENEDGPLGWTAKPEVFAICARILISGAALAKVGDEAVTEALVRFRDEGGKAGVHGSLLAMCDG
ncbi:putative death-receptor fusion protein-domain-containing protein [Hypoxylon sp. FL1150]|nr:putative death-receptor fusion protein-domain-containing protein [Hypoxylon sp. FL1150]